jgi:hypothetical protein
MANEEHLAILKQGVGLWNQWRRSPKNASSQSAPFSSPSAWMTRC